MDKLANFLTDAALEVGNAALLAPAHRVKLQEGWIVPIFDCRAVELSIARDVTLEPGECVAMTVAM